MNVMFTLSNKKLQIFCMLVFTLFTAIGTYAQVLLAGTSFDPVVGSSSSTYFGIENVVQYGLQPGRITVGAALAPNVNANTFNGSFYYAITDNPYKLDNARYSNGSSPDYQLVFSPSTASSNLLEYTLDGIAPGTVLTVNVSYGSAVSATYAPCGPGEVTSFKGVINPDQYNALNGVESPQVRMGLSNVLTFTTTSASSNGIGAEGKAVIRLNSYLPGACKAIAITKIEIFGTPKPQLVAPNGNETCVGEQIVVQTKISYANATYQWQVDDGSGYKNIVGATRSSVLYELEGAAKDYKFRVYITPTTGGAAITSDPITVKAIVCCTIGSPPVAASRQIIFKDDFGTLDLNDKTGRTYKVWDYSDPLNPKEVTKTTSTPFRWATTPAPLGSTFAGTGPLQDGQYTVAGYLTSYNAYNGIEGAKLEWAGNVTGPITSPPIAYDHSGTVEGAALFINTPVNTLGKSIYTRTLSNLCFGKQLFFECWIAVFTNSALGPYNGVNIKMRLTDNGDASNVVEVNGAATRQADGGGVWVRIAGQINLVGTAVNFELVNNQNMPTQLVLDDIIVRSCAPPTAHLYFDATTLATKDTLCENSLLLTAPSSTVLKAFYNNTPYYLFQWTKTPDLASSWKNLGNPQSASIFSASRSTFGNPSNGEKLYFRVVVASQAIYMARSNFQGAGNTAYFYDPCRNYSVSLPIEALVDGSSRCLISTELHSSKETESFHAYPNPVKDLLIVGEEAASAYLYNATGQLVLQSNASTLHVGHLQAGLYQVTVQLKNGKTVTQKVVKE